MSGVLTWLKSNLLIVVFGVLILLLPPAGFIGSSMWNSSIKEAAEETLSSKKRSVEGVAKVRYTLPPITAGEQPYEESRAPNAAVTEYFEQKRAERQEMIERVVTRAVRFNKKEDRAVLLGGLFPGLEDDREERRRAKEMAELIAGDDETPSAYAGLFKSINAGEPMKKAEVARRVIDAHRAETDRAGGDLRSLSSEEQEALAERMKSHRLSVYARRAEELSVYGSPEVLYGANPAEYSEIFEEVPSGSHDATDAFVWQMDYWFVEDLLRAVRLANTTEDGLMTEVPRSPVKRVVSIRLEQLDIPEAESDTGGATPTRGGPSPRGVDPRGMMAPRPSANRGAIPGGDDGDASHTGRSPDEKNGVYTIRRGIITVIASSEGLVRLIEALGRANFMTVIGLSLKDVDLWADLEEGYYYGPDHVVRAEIEVESAWLHFWLADMVPDRVASAWGIERPVDEPDKGP